MNTRQGYLDDTNLSVWKVYVASLYCTPIIPAQVRQRQDISCFHGNNSLIIVCCFDLIWRQIYWKTQHIYPHPAHTQTTQHIPPPRTYTDHTASIIQHSIHTNRQKHTQKQGAVSIRKTVLPGMAIPMLKIRRPNGRLIFNMEIAIRR